MRMIIATATLMLFCNSGACQLSKPKFGINSGLNLSNLRTSQHSLPKDYSATVSERLGYRLGFLIDWKLIRNLSFSPKVELSFSNASIAIKGPNNEKVYEFFPVSTELAGHLTYKLFKNGPTPYLLAGPNYKIPLTDRRSRYATTHPALCIDFGVGVEAKFRKFYLAPELRYSLGPGISPDIDEIGKMNFNTLVLAVNFKGK